VAELDASARGDALTAPYWEGVGRREVVLQHCRSCGSWQAYPRPFCLTCYADELDWSAVTGTGTLYSRTTVRLPVLPELEPPYVVAVVELDEGPRLLTHLVDGDCPIGGRVALTWREREDGEALPVFRPTEGGRDGQA
jgi:uncharacterized OB-fold protein